MVNVKLHKNRNFFGYSGISIFRTNLGFHWRFEKIGISLYIESSNICDVKITGFKVLETMFMCYKTLFYDLKVWLLALKSGSNLCAVKTSVKLHCDVNMFANCCGNNGG